LKQITSRLAGNTNGVGHLNGYPGIYTIVTFAALVFAAPAYAQSANPTSPGSPDPATAIPNPFGNPAAEAPATTPTETAPTPEDGGRPTEAGLSSGQNMRLRALQNRVSTLKREVFRTKTRLMLIKERLLNNVIAESKLLLRHRNNLSDSFVVEEIIYYLDDNKIYFGDARTGDLENVKIFNAYDGNVVPGHHELAVECILSGNSTLFPYMDEFRFRIRSSYTFFAPRGRISILQPTFFERGGLLRDFRDRPAVKYELKQYPYTRENLQKVSQDGNG
jgi:hypothetical protein